MTSSNNNKAFIPVIIYNNPETDKNKILNENKGKAGIYIQIHI